MGELYVFIKKVQGRPKENTRSHVTKVESSQSCNIATQWKQVECSKNCLKDKKCERWKEREFDEGSWREWHKKQ